MFKKLLSLSLEPMSGISFHSYLRHLRGTENGSEQTQRRAENIGKNCECKVWASVLENQPDPPSKSTTLEAVGMCYGLSLSFLTEIEAKSDL